MKQVRRFGNGTMPCCQIKAKLVNSVHIFEQERIGGTSNCISFGMEKLSLLDPFKGQALTSFVFKHWLTTMDCPKGFFPGVFIIRHCCRPFKGFRE